MAPVPREAVHPLETYEDSSSTYEEIVDKAVQVIDYSEWETDSEDEFCFESAGFSSFPRVQFAVTVRRRETISVEDYTEKELKSCWYTPEDKERMTSKHEKMVARVEAGKLAKKSMTYRGLECWTTVGGDLLDSSIARYVDAVMDEQDHQWDIEGKESWDRIASISHAVTGESAQRALELAKHDEVDAKMAWDTPDDSNCITDDESVCGMAHLVAKKRAHRKRKNKRAEKKDVQKDTKDAKPGRATTRMVRRSVGKEPPGKIERQMSQKASDVLTQMRSATRNMKSMKV
jgi:hypothetical protein